MLSAGLVDLAPVAEPQDENQQMVVLDLVHDPIVAGADSPFTRAPHEPGRGWWSGLLGKKFESSLDTAPYPGVELPQLPGRHQRQVTRWVMPSEVCLDLLPGDRRLSGRSHLCPRRHAGPYVRHVLSEFENALEVLGIDDRGHPPTPSGEVDRDVLSASTIYDRCQLLARVRDGEIWRRRAHVRNVRRERQTYKLLNGTERSSSWRPQLFADAHSRWASVMFVCARRLTLVHTSASAWCCTPDRRLEVRARTRGDQSRRMQSRELATLLGRDPDELPEAVPTSATTTKPDVASRSSSTPRRSRAVARHCLPRQRRNAVPAVDLPAVKLSLRHRFDVALLTHDKVREALVGAEVGACHGETGR